MPMKKNILIWDLPLRVFHWLLVLCVLGAVFCVEVLDDAMQWHGYFGYCILVLVSFRIVWGFIGPVHARFTSFVPTPNRLKKYLQGKTAGGLGHNPLGALSVIGLLVVLAVQAGTGLFADDEIASDILEMLSDGVSIETLLQAYTQDEIDAALEAA